MTDPIHITNWRRLDSRVTTSGQPNEGELAEIAALGVTHVVNLALHSHERALPDEAGSAAALGMDYTHIPVAFDNPTDADFARFCDVMRDLDGRTVHVHCIMNFRVTAFFTRYRRDVLGWDEARARADMDAVWQPDPVWTAFVG